MIRDALRGCSTCSAATRRCPASSPSWAATAPPRRGLLDDTDDLVRCRHRGQLRGRPVPTGRQVADPPECGLPLRVLSLRGPLEGVTAAPGAGLASLIAAALDDVLDPGGALTRHLTPDGPAQRRWRLDSGRWRPRDSERLAAAIAQTRPTADNAVELAHQWLITEPPQVYEIRAGRRIDAATVTEVEQRVHQPQRLYLLGVRAAHTGGDAAGAASNLSSLAYQVANVGHPAEALTLARSAYAGARHDATATTRALSAERVAWAAARAVETGSAERALGAVEADVERRSSDDDPEWVYWLDPDEIEIMAGRVWTQLRRPPRAVPILERAVAGYGADRPGDRPLPVLAGGIASPGQRGRAGRGDRRAGAEAVAAGPVGARHGPGGGDPRPAGPLSGQRGGRRLPGQRSHALIRGR
jgi:hypothetical protein